MGWSGIQGGEGAIPGSYNHPYSYNSNKPRGNGDPPGRYRSARCGDTNHTGRSLIGSKSWSSAAYGEDKVSIPGKESLRYMYNSKKIGEKTAILRLDTASHGMETPTRLVNR